MEPVILFVVAGLLGGLALACVFFLWRGERMSSSSPFERDPASTDVINMAHIRVAGIGGLGLLAMALAVALNVPRIGQTLAVGLLLGVGLAAVLIWRRRRDGALTSSGRQSGANTTLAIDAAPETADQPSRRRRLASAVQDRSGVFPRRVQLLTADPRQP